MNRNVLIFLAAFTASALVTLALRAARHEPYASPAAPPAEMPAATEHQHATETPAPITVVNTNPVNSMCAICGMKVNPKLGTALYQGKVIGFGCKACPSKFAANPDLYGPAAIAGQVVEEP
jgi:hypothetical protein